MRYLLYAFLLLCLLYRPPILAQDKNFLDLVKAQQLKQDKIKRKSGTVTTDPVVGITHMPLTPKPFEITLLSLDKQSYRLGEKCVFEIQLENITNNPLVIPWSPYLDDVKPYDSDKNPPGYLKADLSLIIVNKPSQERLISGITIYGSDLARGSLKTLKPKESVKFRVPGRFSFGGDEEVKTTFSRKIEVRAYYKPAERNFNWPLENSMSTNSLTVELTK